MYGQTVNRENSTGLGHTLRSELYQGLQDTAIYDRHDGEDIGPLGCKLILPSSHVGSPRFMTQLFQDAMVICRYFHKPNLFLTMTVNPKWPEILYSLFPGQTDTDHPDIVSWVFEQKKKALLKLIDSGFFVSQTSFSHISISSLTIPMVSIAPKSP